MGHKASPVNKRQAAGEVRSAEPQWVLALLAWFGRNKRSMPWREQPTPYFRWLSEIMLQQTRVDTVIPYFHRFVERYPDIASLAQAEEDDVLKLWEGLGYYSRARNLLKAAREMADNHGGTFPSSEKEALALPGVGPYSAAAVLSMAYGVPLPSVDGNVLRVYCRLTALADNVLEHATSQKVRQSLQKIIPVECPGSFNESLMELGALICLPVNPRCGKCPIRKSCQAYQRGLTDQLPVRLKKDKLTRHHYLVYYLVNETDTSVLLRKNPPQGLLGGLWAFPMFELTEEDTGLLLGTTGKEPAKPDIKNPRPGIGSEAEALERIAIKKAADAWGLRFTTMKYRGKLKHVFSHRRWTMEVLAAATKGPAISEFEWVQLDQLPRLAFPEVYQKVIRLMEERPAAT